MKFSLLMFPEPSDLGTKCCEYLELSGAETIPV